MSSDVTLPALTSIGGYLSVSSNVTLPALTSIGGDLSVYSDVTFEAPALTSIGGDLDVYSNVTLPALTSIGGYLSVSSNVTLPALTSIGGCLSVSSNVTLPALTSIGGDLSVSSNVELEKQLYPKNKKHKWYISELSSDWLIDKKPIKGIYYLNNVEFSREWFLKIKNDTLTPDEIFAIDNIEHRRIAYEFLNKSKMKSLKDYSILHEVENDGYNYPMNIVSFTIQNTREPLIFLNCFCPSTGREYFIGTDKKLCLEAKMASFGLSQDVKFTKEW